MVAPLALLGLSAASDAVGRVLDGLSGSSAKAAGKAGGKAAGAAAGHDKLKKAAADFESVFLEQSFGHLTEHTGEDGPLGAAGAGGSVYRSMLMKEYAGQVAKTGGVGIAAPVYREMLKLQEGSDGSAR